MATERDRRRALASSSGVVAVATRVPAQAAERPDGWNPPPGHAIRHEEPFTHGGGPELHHESRGDITRFHEVVAPHWVHGEHLRRTGWWWVVDGEWYFYPAPLYPYPDPYVPPGVIALAPLPSPVPTSPAYWYYCRPAGPARGPGSAAAPASTREAARTARHTAMTRDDWDGADRTDSESGDLGRARRRGRSLKVLATSARTARGAGTPLSGARSSSLRSRAAR
jgi:hypothetical protein